MEILIIITTALILDCTIGDPPNSWHPVAWLGKLISWQMRLQTQRNNKKQFVYGTITVVLTIALITALAHLLACFLHDANTIIFIIVSAILLKLTFSLCGLKRAVTAVKCALATNNLSNARYLARALVSRDTTGLSKNQLISAAVESSAENICDSFIAPLFYFVLFGIPGALAYRVLNTYDSMIGYHGKWEYLGKCAARLDDLANYIPARLSAIIIVIASWLYHKDAKHSWNIMLRDHGNTESPNAGWTMSAIAGALGIQLEKPGHYKLGDNQQSLDIDTIDISTNLATLVAFLWIILSFIAQGIYSVIS